MEPTIFEAKGLTKKYGSSFALQNLNMTVRSREIYGFVGENGAGKTTLMRIIGGLVQPTCGEMSLFGECDKNRLNLVRRQIGCLIESPALYPNLNAKENLTFYCRIYGVKDESRISDVLQAVSLSDVGNKNISNYSLGMRQRLGLAIALLNKPKFLVLDEPINGLDPTGIIEIRKTLEYLAYEKGVSILISSHILSELQLLATKFGFIHKGRLIREISADELLKSSKTQIVIRTPEPEEAVNLLKNELGINSIKITESREIHIPKESTDLEMLMSVFLQRRIQIEGINLSTPNLENYYMELMKGSE
ncbi:ABC transporter ATP-binding protein [Paenibacillus woosongensis]|uniref:ATP-binding cassette domain-containing protein n=1 Tax=Paenibacillus woosongensis TaxID=307580 RepID=A0A7X2Z1E6_9BACL|nr:ABC transporter ATP-binding protein [Paenibacillus woosongensis]MUG45827.1 ATP-binding cassette domain-containing protein [Paenibacillus woosongensis]